MRKGEMMKVRVLTGAVVFMGIIVALSARSASQEKEGAGQPGEHMMQAWMKYAQPGKFHANLEPLVGRWTTSVKIWMVPDAPPMESEGTSEHKWIMGGRFLHQTVQGAKEEYGPAFEGMGLFGYDNFKKKYTSMWIDNTGTAIRTSLGTGDDSGKLITMVGTFDDVHTGKAGQTSRMVTRIINNDKHIDSMYMPGPNGKEFQSLEVIYTRR